ncbi:AI-2E family transporter [Dongia soli]|uniref:AI-2E family transporter n=1 Tax=Dongia soli TaxID=600628 RepID=A0ABU5E6J0_9PROT|nr:AI-2E family transporter [Dongia soli]MDY0881334.1 AI-2E family transporter [Dongia soli]
MSPARQIRTWLIALAVFIVLLYLLRGILLPFVAGMAMAYVLDPFCDQLERWGLSRTWATSVVTVIALLVVVIILLSLAPVLLQEISNFLSSLPDLVHRAQERLIPIYEAFRHRFNLPPVSELNTIAQSRLGAAVNWLAQAAQQLLGQGLALANLLSLVFITPVVTFYLLRDWDVLVARIDGLLPRQHLLAIRSQFREVDRTLAGFARGQAMVCLTLGVFYAVTLALVGLPFGIVVGLLAGLLTFIPYVGAMTGFITGIAIALAQFSDWTHIAMVAGVFLVGQILESNLLTPKLVGDRVGLHPVWIIFALLAGGALFGFLGLLLAVPAAAAIGVLVRFAAAHYRHSTLYLGPEAAPSGTILRPDQPEE